jgi:hypothetical protein
MRFKTPAPLFNVNGDHGARARRLFVYKSIQDQDPTLNRSINIIQRLLSVVGALIVKE